MKRIIAWAKDKLFGRHIDFRVRLFNVLAMAGTLIGLMMVLLGIVTQAGMVNVVTNIAGAALALGLLVYSQRSGKYRRCYLITIAAIFLVLFPLLFFTAGGYHSGMPSFFIFAVLFTIFMLEGKLIFIDKGQHKIKPKTES